MQYLVVLSLASLAAGQLVVYPNGAVAPYDPNNAAATKDHFAALAEAGAAVNPYNTHAQDLVLPVPAPVPAFYGKRSAQLVTYPNGAQAPYDPNVALATAQHYAAKAAHGSWFPLEGAANVHPPAAPLIVPAIYGRKKRSADAQVLPYFAAPYGLPLTSAYGLAPLAPFAPLVAHPNGAVVPLEPKDVVEARAAHLEAVAEAVAA